MHKMKKIYFLIIFFLNVGILRAENPPTIEYIDIIHFCHTDYGFTDDPAIAEELHRKYLDIGIDAVLETVDNKQLPKFFWTAEALETVASWWKMASQQRRGDLLRAIKSGQLEITAMPFNVHPFFDAELVDEMVNWVPDSLWNVFSPEVAIQHDVNGFPRSIVSKLLKKGVRYFWSGLNLHWGGIFHNPPYAFWWEMPDGEKALVWLGMPYWEGYDFFAETQWRYAQRVASNTQFRAPRPGDMLKADEASVREAHKVCLAKIAKMQSEGYPYDFIATSLTNQYRCDNDGPFPAFAAFVAKWNELGLKPRLNFTTAAEAMKKIEKRIGDKISTHKGEWPDWWSFGLASSPRELSAARQAGLFYKAATASVWGKMPVQGEKKVESIKRDLCRYYEHTFGSWETDSNPFSLFNQSHLNTTNSYAFRPYQQAQWLLAQRVRACLTNESEGLYVINSGKDSYTGWVDIDPASFVRQPYKSVVCSSSKIQSPLLKSEKCAKLWIADLQPNEIRHFLFSTDSVGFSENVNMPILTFLENGWPKTIEWSNCSQKLSTEAFGSLTSLNSLVGRSVSSAWYVSDSVERKKQIDKCTMTNDASYGNVIVEETPYTIIFRQKMKHSSLNSAERRMEIWKEEPRVNCKVVIDRAPDSSPEIIYIHFPFKENWDFPKTSNGGMAFVPYRDQLNGTCTDFYAIDGWVQIPCKTGNWIWSSRDAALVCFGGNRFGKKSKFPPQNVNHLAAMVYNNMWECNFLNDCIGKMEFSFDIVWEEKNLEVQEIANKVETNFLKPIVFINPSTREDKHTFRHLHTIQ